MTPSRGELLRTAGLAVLALLPAVILVQGPGLAAGRELLFSYDVFGSDVWHHNLPLASLYQESLRRGALPLWTDQVGTGLPLHAYGQVAALYPPNVVLYGLLPLPLAFNWAILLHLVAAGVFASMLARQLGAERSAAVVAGLVVCCSGFLVSHARHVNLIAAAAWAPLLLLLLERLAERITARRLVAATLALALMWLAGHPQMAYYGVLVAGGYALGLAAGMVRHGTGPRRCGRPARFLGAAVAALLLALMLAAPQLLPSHELAQHGPRRDGLSYGEATEWRYPPSLTALFLDPFLRGDPGVLHGSPALAADGRQLRGPGGVAAIRLRGFEGEDSLFWEVTGYVGLLPLALALLGVALGFRRRRVLALVSLGALCLLVAWGDDGGVFRLLWHTLPGFQLFRMPSRLLWFVDLSLALLAALGLTGLLERLRRRPIRVSVAVVVALVVFVDLWWALGGLHPRVDADAWTAPPELVRQIRRRAADAEPFRIAHVDRGRSAFRNAYHRAMGFRGDLAPYEVARQALDPNLNVLFRLPSLDAYLEPMPDFLGGVADAFHQPGASDRIADIFNVRYLVELGSGGAAGREGAVSVPGDLAMVAAPTPDGGLAYFEGGRFEIVLRENPDPLPRAYLVGSARRVPGGAAAAIRELQNPRFDPAREVLLSADVPPRQAPVEDGTGPVGDAVRFEHRGPSRVVLSVRAARPAWLVLSDAFYPGWTATVDGEEVPVHRANGAVRAVQVPSGPHRVVFRYRSLPLMVGLGLAAAAGALLVLGAWLGGRRRGRSTA